MEVQTLTQEEARNAMDTLIARVEECSLEINLNNFSIVRIKSQLLPVFVKKFACFAAIFAIKGRKLKDGKDIAVITIGPIGNTAAHAIERAEAEKGSP